MLPLVAIIVIIALIVRFIFAINLIMIITIVVISIIMCDGTRCADARIVTGNRARNALLLPCCCDAAMLLPIAAALQRVQQFPDPRPARRGG